MELNPAHAREALAIAQSAERRSKIIRGYEHTAPHLILWGAIYAAGYGWGFFRPQDAGRVWLVLTPLGLAGSFVIGKRSPTRSGNPASFLAAVAIFTVLIGGTAVIMQPREPNQMAAFVPLLVAAVYAGIGLIAGLRLLALGAALAALTLIGFFALPHIFLLWMAAVGGGALILGGLWLRQP